jgi:hypothetical protein
MNFKIIFSTNVEVKNTKHFTVPLTHQVSKSPSRKSLPRTLAPSHPAPQTSPSLQVSVRPIAKSQLAQSPSRPVAKSIVMT